MKRKWVNRLIALSMTAVMAGSMIGCGGNGNDTSSGTNETVENNAGETVDEPADSGSEGTENVSSDKDAVTVVYNTNNGDMAKWNLEGLYDGEVNWVGLLEPLEPLDDMDDIFKGNVEQHSLGEDLYGYPLTGDAMIMYVNTKIWEEAGYTEDDIPKTFEEYGEKAIPQENVEMKKDSIKTT